jgi:hypothetical protein
MLLWHSGVQKPGVIVCIYRSQLLLFHVSCYHGEKLTYGLEPGSKKSAVKPAVALELQKLLTEVHV